MNHFFMLKVITKFFGLNDETWMQHSNKWSVWTRFFILPLLTLIVWHRDDLDWVTWVFIGLILFWTWINPCFFGKPATTKHWASKAVFGERVWLNTKALPIPSHHNRAILVLNTITGLGLPFLACGLYQYDFWMTIFGLTLVILGKLWFLDRMVWIYEDMKNKSKIYTSWEY